jgi:hypothetical protein
MVGWLAVGRDRFRHAEDGPKNLDRDAAIKNPEKVRDKSAQDGQQPLHRSLLESQYYPGDSGD